MPTTNEVKSIANTVRDNKNALSQKYNAYDRSASSVSSSWKGDIGEAFKDVAKRVKAQMSTTLKDYGNLNTKLISLSGSVKKAENEEKKANKL